MEQTQTCDFTPPVERWPVESFKKLTFGCVPRSSEDATGDCSLDPLEMKGILFMDEAIPVVFLLCWLRTELNLRWVRDRSSFYSFHCQKEVQRVSTLQSSLAIFLSRMRTEK